MQRRAFFAIILLASLVLSGCTLPWKKKAQELPDQANASEETEEASYSGQLKKFKDLQSLDSFLRAEAGNPAAMEQSDYQGEPVAMSGDYLYASVYNDIYIVKASAGEQGRAVAKITFNSRPLGVFVMQGKLVVIGNDEQLLQTQAYKSFRRQSPFVYVKVFDLADPASPKQVRDLSFEGRLLDTSVSGGSLRLLLENYFGYVAGESPTPRLVDGGRILSNDCSSGSRCFLPETYYFDVDYPEARTVSVDTIDLSKDDSLVASTAFIVSPLQEAFFSGESLYLTHKGQFDGSDGLISEAGKIIEAKLSESNRALVEKIRETDPSVLTSAEKTQKISALYQSYLISLDEATALATDAEIENALKTAYAAGKASTAIYKFKLGVSAPTYRAIGAVEGEIITNGASEDPSGNLRLITKKSESLDATGELSSRAYLSVLDPGLEPSGSAIEIADTAEILQVAFSARKASLLAKEALYSADITNPQAPKLLGKAIAPSVRALYMYGDSYAIALADENGQAKAVLFDLSGTAVRESDTFRFGAGSETYISTDSRFQAVDTLNNHVVIPITRRQGSAISFSGITALSVGEGRFLLRGDVDHSNGGRYLQEDTSLGAGFRNNTVRASWIKNGSLYTFSNKYIKVNALEGGASVQDIKLLPDTEADLAVPQPEITQETPSEGEADNGPIGPALPPVETAAPDQSVAEPAGDTPITPEVPLETPENPSTPEAPAGDPIETPTDPIDSGIQP